MPISNMTIELHWKREPLSESDKRHRAAICDIEDEARPYFDRSKILPNRDGSDLWMFVDTRPAAPSNLTP